MSAFRDNIGRFVSFDCPIQGCVFAVSGNFGQEADDAISHIEEDHWTDDLTDDEREALLADVDALGFAPVGPGVTCFCGGDHVTGSCLAPGSNAQEPADG